MKVQPARLGKFFLHVRIIVYCLKIIGLAPFSVRTPTSIMNSRRAPIKTFRYSKFGLAYNILIISLYLVLVVLSRHYWSSDRFLQKSPVLQSISAIRLIFRAFAGIVVTSCWAFRQRKAVRIMNEIFKVDVEIARLRKQPCYRRSPIFLTVHVIINAYIWITFCITNVAWVGAVYNFATSILTIGSVLVLYWFTVEYFFVVGRIARNLETVNKNLLNLEGSRNSYVSHSPFVNEFLHAFSSPTQSSQVAALRSLVGIRVKLSELAQDVEDFFSFPILISCAFSFMAIVFTLYHFIMKLMSSNNDTSLYPVFNLIAWILIEIYPLISLSTNVTRTEKQAKLTAHIVRKLLVKPRAKPLGLQIKVELEKFSLQLIHEDFSFTANGFFPLDYKLLHSMMAATTTYLVILLQFQSSDSKS